MLRGNVVELAVVIGAASTAVVDRCAEPSLLPLVDPVGGGGQLVSGGGTGSFSERESER